MRKDDVLQRIRSGCREDQKYAAYEANPKEDKFGKDDQWT